MRYADMTPLVRSRLQLAVDGCTRREDSHLIYTGNLPKGRPPTLVTSVLGVPITLSVRRFLWLQSRRPLQDCEVLRYTCGEPACVNPKHAKAYSMQENGRISGRISSPARKAACRRAGKLAQKLTDAQRLEVMQWEGPFKKAMEHFGISQTMYFRIRAGRSLGSDPLSAMTRQLRRAA